MDPVYSGPIDPPEPCCTEEPDHDHYGYPKPDVTDILNRCTPDELRRLAEGALWAMAELGQEIQLTEPAEHCAIISEDLTERAPDWLPTIVSDRDKPAARWWCDVLGVDRGDDIVWTPEEEDE